MNAINSRTLVTALVISPLLFACSPARQPDKAATPPADSKDMAGMSGMNTPVTIPKGVLYTAADVHFMQGMIAHHGQAIFMSRMAV